MELHPQPRPVGVFKGLNAVGAGGDHALIAANLLDHLAMIFAHRRRPR